MKWRPPPSPFLAQVASELCPLCQQLTFGESLFADRCASSSSTHTHTPELGSVTLKLPLSQKLGHLATSQPCCTFFPSRQKPRELRWRQKKFVLGPKKKGKETRESFKEKAHWLG